MFIKDIQVK